MRTQNREKELNNNGIDTSRFFSFQLPNGLKPGSTITLAVSESGELVMDQIAEGIIEKGYVKNHHLFRRWVMAQMFKMLNYVSYDGKEEGFDAYLKYHYPYKYQFEMMKDEIYALSKMEKEGGKDFEIRKSFFTPARIALIIHRYASRLYKVASSKPVKHCKGKPYIRMDGMDIFVEDFWKHVQPIRVISCDILKAKSYRELYEIYLKFMKLYINLPWETPKVSEWNSTFKGEGAYYTLQNLIRFHEFKIYDGNNVYSGKKAEDVLEQKRLEYLPHGYKMFAFMKAQIEFNHFDFNKRMREIYSNR